MSPTLELQGAIVATLKAAAPVVALIAQRVYSPAPATAVYPFVEIGNADELQEDATCIRAVSIRQLLDVYSREPGRKQAAQIAGAVKAALHEASLTITTNALVEIRHRQTLFQEEEGGLTQRAIIELIAIIEES